MRRGIIALAATGLLAVTGLTACGDDDGGDGGSADKKPKIGVILPDSKSSARWETADRKFLEAAFKGAGVDYDIQNAQGDKNAFQTIADQMISSGVTALMIVNLDSGTGKAVLDKAKQQGVATIDYDRLTLGGSADYYVSFNNVTVGELQGEGLIKCLGDKKPANIIQLNGSPTDNNATLFKQGAVSKLKPKYDAGDYKLVGDKAVPDWDNAQAGVIFEQLLTAADGKVDGVLAANDGLGNAAISALKARKLEQIPVTGQDATAEGIQNILAGDQCMTVYKAIKAEADAAAKLAIALAKGEEPPSGLVNGETDDGSRKVPSALLKPVTVTKENIADTVIKDGFLKREEICTGKVASVCEEAGV